jgi:glycosyltransferase involved in cell wall biosynthesis
MVADRTVAWESVRLVIPCYNEEGRLPADEYLRYLATAEGVVLLFVDDGSRDATLRLLEEIRRAHPGRVRLLPLERNVGKAAAVRAGVLSLALDVGWEWVGYLDADLATPLEEVALLRQAAARPGVRMVMGSRVRRLGSDIRRNSLRHAVGRLYATLFSHLLSLPVYDSQCGAKLLDRATAQDLFALPFDTRWLLDVELIFRLRERIGVEGVLRTVVEVPLERWWEKGRSALRPWDAPATLLQVFRLAWRHRRGRETAGRALTSRREGGGAHPSPDGTASPGGEGA